MALITCSECGKQYSDKAIACPNCGNPTHIAPTSTQPMLQTVNPYATQSQANHALSQYAEKLATKEQTSGIIWGVIAIIQIIIGCFGFWSAFIVAALNGYGAYLSFQKAKKVRNPYPGMVEEYEKQLTSLIIAFVYNAIFGGVIGVAGNIFDLTTRNYVLTNRSIFESTAKENAEKAESEANASGKICLTVQYTSSGGAATAAQYTVDGQPEKYTVSTTTPVKTYLNPGSHTITFKWLFKNIPFTFEVNEDTVLSFHGTVKEITLNSQN